MQHWIQEETEKPMRRFSSPTNSAFSTYFGSQYMEGSHNIWGQCPLKPSTSIWGSKIQSPNVNPGVPHEWDASLANAHPSYPIVSLGIQGNPIGAPRGSYASTRSSSVPSLSSSVASSPLWFEEPYLFSPPQSPEAQVKRDSRSTPPPLAGGLLLSSAASHQSVYPSTNSASTSGAASPTRLNGLDPVSSFSHTVSPASVSSDKLVISCSCGPLYVVQFKGNRRDVFTAPGTTTYSVGDAVMVDADRGRDLGVITLANVSRHDAAALKQQQHSDRQLVLNSNGSNAGSPSANESASAPTVYTPKQILGNASASEIKDLAAKVEDEKNAVLLCNKKAAERNLDMEIVDAEYQWDRRKLTFFYTANSRVDFRDLVRELFRIYKTRIWMCATTART